MTKHDQDQFRAAFNHIPVAAILLDNNCRVERINKVASKLFQLQSPVHAHQSLNKLIRDGYIPQEARQVCCSHQTHHLEEVSFVTKAQTQIYLKIVAAKIKSTNSHHNKWIIMLEDITGSVKAKKLISTLTNRILQAHEDEKRMISNEIHDSVSQSLAAMKMSIQSGADKTNLINQVDQLIQTTRSLSQNLRPEVIDKIGLIPALEQLADSIRQRFNSAIIITETINHSNLDSVISLQLYRIAQEAILNAARHGQAQNIQVNLSKRAGKLRLIIKDDGKGFDQNQNMTHKKTQSLGLNVMQERAKRINGSFSVQSKINQGTTISVCCQIN